MHPSTTNNTSHVTVCTFMLKDSEHSGQNFLFGSSGIQLGLEPPSFEKRPEFSIKLTKNTSNTLVTQVVLYLESHATSKFGSFTKHPAVNTMPSKCAD